MLTLRWALKQTVMALLDNTAMALLLKAATLFWNRL